VQPLETTGALRFGESLLEAFFREPKTPVVVGRDLVRGAGQRVVDPRGVVEGLFGALHAKCSLREGLCVGTRVRGETRQA